MGTWVDHRRTILDGVERLPALPWSLRIIVDETGSDTGFVALRGRIEEDTRAVFDQVAASHRVIGMMQWWGFPVPHYSYAGERYAATPRDPSPSPWDRPEIEVVEAWCYCARDPDAFLPPDRPRFLLSNSDFVDAAGIWAAVHGRARVPSTPPQWDVICSFSGHWFDEIQKNWSLARACVETLAVDRDLSVLLLSRSGIPDLPRHPNVEVRPRLRWEDCMQCLARSRLALLPNHLDPSPRFITESMALNVPVLVNSQILGGWKYVHDETGRFFDDDFDVAAEVDLCLSTACEPRDWVRRHHGRDRAARRLAGYLRSLGGADHITYALPTALFL